jgi:hypothetical protein
MEGPPIRHPQATPCSTSHLPPLATHTEGYSDILIMTSHTSFLRAGSNCDLLCAIVILASANEGATETA